MGVNGGGCGGCGGGAEPRVDCGRHGLSAWAGGCCFAAGVFGRMGLQEMRGEVGSWEARLDGGEDKVGVAADAGVHAVAALNGAPVGVGGQLGALAEDAYEPGAAGGVAGDGRAARIAEARVLAGGAAGADHVAEVDVAHVVGVGVLPLAVGLRDDAHVDAHEVLGVHEVGVGNGAETSKRYGRADADWGGSIDAVDKC
jgi:hypothetical protein